MQPQNAKRFEDPGYLAPAPEIGASARSGARNPLWAERAAIFGNLVQRNWNIYVPRRQLSAALGHDVVVTCLRHLGERTAQ
jgi:hypothetical protein